MRRMMIRYALYSPFHFRSVVFDICLVWLGVIRILLPIVSQGRGGGGVINS